MKKRMLALTLALSLLLVSCGGGAEATTMRLRKTEGTVGVSDGAGKEIEPSDGLSLYSGYGVDTSSESYAWIDLDDVKLTKLDQDSEIAIAKEDKKLEVEVKSGSLFFNVTEPLADDESMNIRTSTMLMGIRGTCGWVTQDAAALLEGTVEVTAGEQSATVSAGELAVLTEDGELEVRELYAEDVPAFVAAEIGDRFPLEPAPAIPYAEANGLSFSKEKSYTIPAFTCLTDPTSGEPASIDGVSITGVVDASYTIGDISVSEADADGMVQMTIPCQVHFTTAAQVDDSKFQGDFHYAWNCTSLGLFDYYSGMVIPTDGTLSDTVLEDSIDITYQDVTYPIVYTRSMTENTDLSDWANVGGDIYELQITVTPEFTYTINMPKEYDGLCLFLYLPGNTERAEAKEDPSEIGCLLEAIEKDEQDINDFVLMRVSDLME